MDDLTVRLDRRDPVQKAAYLLACLARGTTTADDYAVAQGVMAVEAILDAADWRHARRSSRIREDISVYVKTPDCSCGHPQKVHAHPDLVRFSGAPSCSQCFACKEYDGVIETLGVGRSPDHLYPAEYDSDGCLILPPELA